jgi:hypothetical protein
MDNIITTVIGGLIVAGISGSFGYYFKTSLVKRKINSAPERYVERLNQMINKAYIEGPEKCIIHGKAIVATRDTLRNSLQSAASTMNSQLDRLASQLNIPYTYSESYKMNNAEKVYKEEVWETIQVLYEYWPAKKIEIEYEIRKIIAELDLN